MLFIKNERSSWRLTNSIKALKAWTHHTLGWSFPSSPLSRFTIHHSYSLPPQTQNTPFPQILPTTDHSDCLHGLGTVQQFRLLLMIFLVCVYRLNWPYVSFPHMLIKLHWLIWLIESQAQFPLQELTAWVNSPSWRLTETAHSSIRAVLTPGMNGTFLSWTMQ